MHNPFPSGHTVTVGAIVPAVDSANTFVGPLKWFDKKLLGDGIMSKQNSQNKNQQNSQNKNNQSSQNKNEQNSQNKSENNCNN